MEASCCSRNNYTFAIAKERLYKTTRRMLHDRHHHDLHDHQLLDKVGNQSRDDDDLNGVVLTRSTFIEHHCT